MSRKFTAAAILAFVVILCLSAVSAYAFDCGKAKGHRFGFGKKFSFKAGLILKNKEELGLSDEQVKRIKDLKLTVKKDSIRRKAEIEVIALDIKARMHEGAIDTEEVEKLIDKKYDLKKEEAKSTVTACAALKGILTETQKEKLKGLRKECKKGLDKHKMDKKKHKMHKAKSQ